MESTKSDIRSKSKAATHFTEGLHFWRVSFDRTLAMYHFGQTVRYQPNHVKGWCYYLASIFWPRFTFRK